MVCLFFFCILLCCRAIIRDLHMGGFNWQCLYGHHAILNSLRMFSDAKPYLEEAENITPVVTDSLERTCSMTANAIGNKWNRQAYWHEEDNWRKSEVLGSVRVNRYENKRWKWRCICWSSESSHGDMDCVFRLNFYTVLSVRTLKKKRT